jgi:hypothetical protein
VNWKYLAGLVESSIRPGSTAGEPDLKGQSVIKGMVKRLKKEICELNQQIWVQQRDAFILAETLFLISRMTIQKWEIHDPLCSD